MIENLENFREITPEMIEIIKDIKQIRECNALKCCKCPFSFNNAVNGFWCSKNKYAEHGNINIVLNSIDELLELVKNG